MLLETPDLEVVEKTALLPENCTMATLSGTLSGVYNKKHDILVNINVEGNPVNIDIDRYVGMYEKRLKYLKGVCVINPNLNGHQNRYVALSDTYFILLEENKLTYKSNSGYEALNKICHRIGYWPFK